MGKFSGLQNLATRIADLDGEDYPTRSNPSFGITSAQASPFPAVSTGLSASLVVPLSTIAVGSRIRQYLDTEKTESLAHSIRQYGFRGVLWVRQVEGCYHLIAGGRRYAACQMAGISEVPVEVWDVTDAEAIQLELLENFQREDLNPIEEAEGILRMLEVTLSLSRSDVTTLLRRKGRQGTASSTEDKMTPTSDFLSHQQAAAPANLNEHAIFEQVDEVFRLIGKYSSESFRTHRLPLLNLPPMLVEAISNGKLEYTKARAIARIKDESLREDILKQVLETGMSHAEIGELAKQAEIRPSSEPPLDQRVRDRVQTVARRFRSAKLEGRALKKVEKLLDQLEALLD